MSDPFNRHSGLIFDRTQPREWRDIPFADDKVRWRPILKGIVIAFLWAALFGLSLWSISQSVQPQTQARTK